jgi:hypothetical protein
MWLGLVCLTQGCGPTQVESPEAPGPTPQARAEQLAEARGFEPKHVKVVEKAGAAGPRHELHFDGVPIWGLEAKTANGKTRFPNVRLEPGTRVDTQPRVTQAQAELAVLEAMQQPSAVVTEARLMLLPHEEYRLRPDAPATARPHAAHYERVVTGFTLVYRLLLSSRDAHFPQARPWIARVDARSGQVLLLEPLQRDNSFQPVTGHGLFVGRQQLLVESDGTEYYLADAHGNEFKGVTLHNGEDHPLIYRSTDAFFGDGMKYTPIQGPLSENGETAAVDAFHAVHLTWRVFSEVLGRNGPNGKGRSMGVMVHKNITDNAVYIPDMKRPTMWFGYSNTIIQPTPVTLRTPMTTADIVGHEVGHDFFNTEIANTLADLSVTMSDVRAMDEATGDIIGFMTEMARDVAATGRPLSYIDRLPLQEHHLQAGEQTGFVRRHYLKPTIPEWYRNLGTTQVPHLAAGPIVRMFVLLAYGCKPLGTTGVDPAWTCSQIPNGFAGVGPITAFRIWAKTVEALPPGADFHQAADLAQELARQFDTPSHSGHVYRAVASALAAVNLGPPPDVKPPTLTLTCKQVQAGIECTGTMADAESAFSLYNDPFIALDGVRHALAASTAPFTHTFPGASLTAGDHSIDLVAWDGWENRASKRVTVVFDKAGPQASVARSGAPKQPVLTVSATDPSGISRVEFLEGTRLLRTVSVAPYAATFDTSTWTDGTHTLVIKAYDRFDNVSVVQAMLAVDNTRPVVTLTVGSGGEPPFSVSATATDGSTLVRADFKVNGATFATRTTGSPYFASYVPSASGPGSLSVEVTDAFGNVGVATAVAPPDQTPPAVLFTPQQGLAGEMTLTVNVADTCGIQYPYALYVDGILVGQPTTPGYVVLLASSAVSVGPHAFHAVVTDTCGNTTTYQTVFHKVHTPPGIIVTRDDSQPKKPKFKVQCNDFDGVLRAELFEAGHPLRRDETPPYEFVVDTTARANGDSQVEIRCIDIYGAMSTNEVFTVTADNAGPHIQDLRVFGFGRAYHVSVQTVTDPRGIKSVTLSGGLVAPAFTSTLTQAPWFANFNFSQSNATIQGPFPFWVSAKDTWDNESSRGWWCNMDTATTQNAYLSCTPM